MHTQRALAPERPYFIYLATGAAHLPHHVPKEWIARYRGRFDGGWDRLREATFARQNELGVVPAAAKLTPRPKELPAWDSFSYAITAEVVIPESGAEGVILALGGRDCGFSFYVKAARVVYESHCFTIAITLGRAEEVRSTSMVNAWGRLALNTRMRLSR